MVGPLSENKISVAAFLLIEKNEADLERRK